MNIVESSKKILKADLYVKVAAQIMATGSSNHL